MTLPNPLVQRTDLILQSLGGFIVGAEFLGEESLGKISLFNGFSILITPLLDENGLPIPRYNLLEIGYEAGTEFSVYDSNFNFIYSGILEPTIEGQETKYYWGTDAGARDLLATASNVDIFYLQFNAANSPQLVQIITKTRVSPLEAIDIIDSIIELEPVPCSTTNELFIEIGFGEYRLYYNTGTQDRVIDIEEFPYLSEDEVFVSTFRGPGTIPLTVEDSLWFTLRRYGSPIFPLPTNITGLSIGAAETILLANGYRKKTDSLWLNLYEVGQDTRIDGIDVVPARQAQEITLFTSLGFVQSYEQSSFEFIRLGEITGENSQNVIAYSSNVGNALISIPANFYFASGTKQRISSSVTSNYRQLRFATECGFKLNTDTLENDSVITLAQIFIQEARRVSICSDCVQIEGIEVLPIGSPVTWTQVSGRPVTFDNPNILNPTICGLTGNQVELDEILLQITVGTVVDELFIFTRPTDFVETKYSMVELDEYSSTNAVNINLLFTNITEDAVIPLEEFNTLPVSFTFNNPIDTVFVDKFELLLNATGQYLAVAQTSAAERSFTPTVLPGFYKIRAFFNKDGVIYTKDSITRYLTSDDFGATYGAANLLSSNYGFTSTSAFTDVPFVYSVALIPINEEDTLLSTFSYDHDSLVIAVPYVYNASLKIINIAYDNRLAEPLISKYSSIYNNGQSSNTYVYNRGGLLIG